MKYNVRDFYDSFMDDLGDFFETTGSKNSISVKRIKFKDFDEEQTKIKQAYNKAHKDYINENIQRIEFLEKNLSHRLTNNFSDFNIDNIIPILRPLPHDKSRVNKQDLYLVEYMRAYQKVKSRKSIGRENTFILEDHGGHLIKTMGVIILASPLYFVGKRDSYLTWQNSPEYKLIREKGLTRMMHLSLCCALPPYNKLGAAKLLSISAFSDIVYNDYCSKWRGKDKDNVDLAIITTSTPMGLTGTPFQRIKINSLFDMGHAPNKINSYLWNRIKTLNSPQEINSYSNAIEFLSNKSLEIARALNTNGVNSVEIAAINIMKSIGVKKKDLNINKRGFFIGYLSDEALNSIKNGTKRNSRELVEWRSAISFFNSLYYNTNNETTCSKGNLTEHMSACIKRREKANYCNEKEIFLSSTLS